MLEINKPPGWLHRELTVLDITTYLFLVIIGREEEFSGRLSKNANFSGFTPLHYAALADDYECIKLLLDKGDISEFSFTSFIIVRLLHLMYKLLQVCFFIIERYPSIFLYFGVEL